MRAGFDFSQISGEGQERPRIPLRGAPMAVAPAREKFRRQFVDSAGARLVSCPGEQLDCVLARDRSEPLLDVSRVHARPRQQLLDERFRSVAFQDCKSDERAIFRA